MAPTSRWCANRRYSEERVALEEACGLRPLADGERDPLAPEPRGEDGPGDTSDHPEPVALDALPGRHQHLEGFLPHS